MKHRRGVAQIEIDVEIEQAAEQPVAAKRLVHVSTGLLRAGGASQRAAVESLLADITGILSSPAAIAAWEAENRAKYGQPPKTTTCIRCEGTGEKQHEPFGPMLPCWGCSGTGKKVAL